MKTVSILALTLALCSCGKEAPAGPAPAVPESPTVGAPPARAHKYGVKSGIVHYELGSKAGTLTKAFYFDDYGAKECIETSHGGALVETQFTDGTDRYTIRTDEPSVAWNQGPAPRGLAMKVSRKEIKGQRGTTDLPDRTLCGKECEAYTVKSGKRVVTLAGWQGVLMLMESDSSQGVFERAVRAEFDVAVPAEKFQVPAGCEAKTP